MFASWSRRSALRCWPDEPNLLRLLAPLCCLALLGTAGHGVEPRTAPVAGLRDNTPQTHALVGAKLVIAPGRIVEKGNVVLRDGLITAVGTDVSIPSSAVVWDMAGRTIYAGFVDAGGEQDVEAPRSAVGGWNASIRPHVRLDENVPNITAATVATAAEP